MTTALWLLSEMVATLATISWEAAAMVSAWSSTRRMSRVMVATAEATDSLISMDNATVWTRASRSRVWRMPAASRILRNKG